MKTYASHSTSISRLLIVICVEYIRVLILRQSLLIVRVIICSYWSYICHLWLRSPQQRCQERTST